MATPARSLGASPEMANQIVPNQNSPAPRQANSDQPNVLAQDTVTLSPTALAQTSGTQGTAEAPANGPAAATQVTNGLPPLAAGNGLRNDANAEPGRVANQQPAATTAASSQQEELAQLATLLQQLGINPGSISTSEQIQLLAYMSDPAALANAVKSLDTIGSQPATATNPPQSPNAIKSSGVKTLNVVA